MGKVFLSMTLNHRSELKRLVDNVVIRGKRVLSRESSEHRSRKWFDVRDKCG